MKFYTSVSRIGDSIVYRGYEEGRRVKLRIPYSPTLFVSSNKSSKWKTLDNKPVEPISFSTMKEATDFWKEYENVPNFTVYGTSNFVSQFVYDEFPNDISFERDRVNVVFIDIEVASDDGFPEPTEASKEVISICLKSSKNDVFIVWGCGDFDQSKSIFNQSVRYVKCHSELDLLMKFLSYWSAKDTSPDIVTGWNTRLFDIPYLVNRIKKVFGDETYRKVSPFNVVREKNFAMNGRHHQAYEVVGIEQLDYYDLFQKFGVYSFGVQESYKLDNIANVVLGEKKLSYEEHGTLHTLYKNDYQKFIDYNIKDVQLVERLEDKMGLITLAMTMGYKAGCNYTDAFGTTTLWDTYIYRELTRNNIVVPPKVDKSKTDIAGGFVKSPHIGRHSWVVSFDLNSLYPHLMLQYNMSPETIMNERTSGVDVKTCLNKVKPESLLPDCCVAANGVHFRKEKLGVIPKIIDKLYSERSEIKKEMLRTVQQMETEGKNYQLEKKQTTLDTQQMAIKIMMNSLYGAMGNRWFRYFDIRMAEAITLSGQLSILWAEKTVNAYMNKLLETKDVDYVIAIDTDSVYINFGPFVERLGISDKQKIVEVIDKVASEKFEPLLEKSYDELAEYMNAYENKMVMKREGISDSGIWTAKKRYILNVYNNEGVQYAKPKLKIMGIEAIKSSTPSSCRVALKELFKVILVGSERQTQEAIQQFKSYFYRLPAHEVAFPRGVSDITSWKDRKQLYKKGTPIHVRGSIMYNKTLVDLGLDKKYNSIKDGEKIKFLYLKMPNPTKENVIAFLDYLPSEMKLENYIDYDIQFDKSFMAVVRPVLEAIGWREEDSVSLEDFFV